MLLYVRTLTHRRRVCITGGIAVELSRIVAAYPLAQRCRQLKQLLLRRHRPIHYAVRSSRYALHIVYSITVCALVHGMYLFMYVCINAAEGVRSPV